MHCYVLFLVSFMFLHCVAMHLSTTFVEGVESVTCEMRAKLKSQVSEHMS